MWDNSRMDVDRLRTELPRRMKARGYTAKSLSLAAGHGPTYVRDLLKNTQQQPTLDRVRRLAVLLDCTLADLVGQGPGLAETTGNFDGPTPEQDGDEEYAELSAAVEAMLREEQMPTDTRTVAKLTREVWREIQVLPRALPFLDRMEQTLSMRRSIVKNARTAIFQRARS